MDAKQLGNTPACNCLAEVNAGLAGKKLRVHTPLIVSRSTGEARPPEPLVVVETIKSGSIPRYGHVAVIYCPWCGVCLRPDRIKEET